jgi:hypothetical protein
VGLDLDAFDEKTYKSREKSIPRFICYNNLNEQIKAISSIIQRNTLADVGILLPHNDNVRIVSSFLNSFRANH